MQTQTLSFDGVVILPMLVIFFFFLAQIPNVPCLFPAFCYVVIDESSRLGAGFRHSACSSSGTSFYSRPPILYRPFCSLSYLDFFIRGLFWLGRAHVSRMPKSRIPKRPVLL